MKNFKTGLLVLAALAVFLCPSETFAQDDFASKYPHVTADLAEDDPLFIGLRHVLALPGVWGLGAYGSYNLPFNLHVSADAGYGWVISEHKEEHDKKFRGWIDIRAGYSVFNFTSRKTGKWVTSEHTVGNVKTTNFYRIKVPNHHKIIVEAGYSSVPTTIKLGQTESLYSAYNSFQAPVYSLGIKWSAYSKSSVKVRDSSSGEVNTGSTQRLFEFEAGIVIPSKDQIEAPASGWKTVAKSEVRGYYFVFRFPNKLNTIGTFDIGIRSLGYDDSAQFYLGNTFYL
jgi:hypothetical protein